MIALLQCEKSLQVLADVAIFVTPNTLQRGHFRLKQEAWSEFEPCFPYFSPHARQTAVDRGISLKLWKPHQQLQGLPQNLPCGLQELSQLPSSLIAIR